MSLKHESDKMIAFERGGLLFIVNLHPTASYVDYKIGVNEPGKYKLYNRRYRILLNSDDWQYRGHGRVNPDCTYFSSIGPWHNRQHWIQAYVPNRTAIVLGLDSNSS